MYYLILNGTQSGPYPLDQIRTMMASGQIESTTLCWTEGQAEWQPIGNVLGPVGHVPPPVPQAARSGLRFFFGGVGVTLAIVGAVLLTLLVVVGGIVGYAAYKGKKLDDSSKAYVDQAVPAIITTWSRDELKKAATDEQIDKLFVLFQRLGAFKSYKGCTGDSNVNYQAGQGTVITAKYVATASFENGDAEIQIALIQKNGEWEILGFHVNSPAFIK